MPDIIHKPLVAVACGGTGGHLFPGIAVAEEMIQLGCRVTLLISPKEVDQQAVKSVFGMKVEVLPAAGLTRGSLVRFGSGFWKSYRVAAQLFAKDPPSAVLAMGGFTSAPPVLAGKRLGARTYLHESNTIPGRANRWLANVVDAGFVYFHEASGRMNLAKIATVGMPVRTQFTESVDAASARMALGLEATRPTLLVMGGSQGASGINELVLKAAASIAAAVPQVQFFHLTGPRDGESVQQRYRAMNLSAVVRPFLTEMELALGAATVAISRAGASSLAEISALRVPSVLIPYPSAADDHQQVNAEAFSSMGAALTFPERSLDAQSLAKAVAGLLLDDRSRRLMQSALATWYFPNAAQDIARHITSELGLRSAPKRDFTQPTRTEAPRGNGPMRDEGAMLATSR